MPSTPKTTPATYKRPPSSTGNSSGCLLSRGSCFWLFYDRSSGWSRSRMLPSSCTTDEIFNLSRDRSYFWTWHFDTPHPSLRDLLHSAKEICICKGAQCSLSRIYSIVLYTCILYNSIPRRKVTKVLNTTVCREIENGQERDFPLSRRNERRRKKKCVPTVLEFYVNEYTCSDKSTTLAQLFEKLLPRRSNASPRCYYITLNNIFARAEYESYIWVT